MANQFVQGIRSNSLVQISYDILLSDTAAVIPTGTTNATTCLKVGGGTFAGFNLANVVPGAKAIDVKSVFIKARGINGSNVNPGAASLGTIAVGLIKDKFNGAKVMNVDIAGTLSATLEFASGTCVDGVRSEVKAPAGQNASYIVKGPGATDAMYLVIYAIGAASVPASASGIIHVGAILEVTQ